MLRASIKPSLELHGTTFFDCGNMPRIFSSIKLVSRKILTPSFSTMWIFASIRESRMRTCKSGFPMTLVESLETELRCTFPAACHRTVQCSGRNAFSSRFCRAPVSNKHWNRCKRLLYIPTNADTKYAAFPIICPIYFLFSDYLISVTFDLSHSSQVLAFHQNVFLSAAFCSGMQSSEEPVPFPTFLSAFTLIVSSGLFQSLWRLPLEEFSSRLPC